MEKLKQIDNIYEDQETLQMIRDYEAGKFVPVKNQKKAKAALRQMARRYMKEHDLNASALKKQARINIRMTGADLEDLKRRAAEEGMPYQTLIASVLHKYVTGRLKDVRITRKR
jgi:predicted DNA binding CopG/RHH family protein